MSVFKAYDIRGVAGSEITEELAYKIGRAFGTFIPALTICVGRDARESSPALFDAFTRGLLDQGKNVVDIGLVTTPMLYFAVAHYGFGAGVSVTASHNPAKYNGFKLVREKAIPLSNKTGIEKIEHLVELNKFPDVDKGTITTKEILQDYIDRVVSFVDNADLKHVKLAVDTGNGMAGQVMPGFLEKLNAEVFPLYFDVDMSFPNHEANPLKHETLQELQKTVKENNADVGVAFDGDSDRIGFIDEKGDIIASDMITALIAKDMLRRYKGATVCYDLRSSRIVKEIIEEHSGKAVPTPVGHSFIKQIMRKEKAVFAGEVSGHFYLTENYVIESPEIMLLYVLRIMANESKPLSELIAPLKKYHNSGEINFEIDDKEGAMKRVEQEFSDGTISHLDGLSVDFDDWWLNIRPSNTEPLLRMVVEADTKEKMEEMKEKITQLLKV